MNDQAERDFVSIMLRNLNLHYCKRIITTFEIAFSLIISINDPED